MIDVEELNDGTEDKYASTSSLIVVEALSESTSVGLSLPASVAFSPSREMLVGLFEETIQKSVLRICNKHKMLVNMEEFSGYTHADFSPDAKEMVEDTVDLHAIVHSGK